MKARIKSFVHARKKGFVIKPEQRHACGLCIKARREKAIRLVGVVQ